MASTRTWVMRMVTSLLLIAGFCYLALCALLLIFQRGFIYFPTERGAQTELITLERDDARIEISTRVRQSQHAVLYLGGNAEDVSHALEPLSRSFPDAAIYAMHYRSYGGSTGTPSEQAIVADAKALLAQLTKTHPRITVIGRSLGSGVAVQIAASSALERLILVTPFSSLADVAAEHFSLFPVRLLLRDRYESWRYVGELKTPTTIIVAAGDEIISAASTQKLVDAFPAGVVNLVQIADAGHNDISNFDAYSAALRGESELTL